MAIKPAQSQYESAGSQHSPLKDHTHAHTHKSRPTTNRQRETKGCPKEHTDVFRIRHPSTRPINSTNAEGNSIVLNQIPHSRSEPLPHSGKREVSYDTEVHH
jgi:hypothetical protein